MEKPKTPMDKFQQKLDNSIIPLIDQAVDYASKPVTKEALTAQFYELFAMAILEGIKLSEKTEEALDYDMDQRVKGIKKTDIERNMIKYDKEADAAARLQVANNQVMPDGTPRFVSGTDLDPVTGEYIKGKK